MQAASIVLMEAEKREPLTIRAFSEETQRATQAHSTLREEVQSTFETEQIIPWFQLQIFTDTGKVTGFEALTLRHHPERGMIAPSRFFTRP